METSKASADLTFFYDKEEKHYTVIWQGQVIVCNNYLDAKNFIETWLSHLESRRVREEFKSAYPNHGNA